ncbi:hypothetical protein BMD_1731 [Priestia megaterium DSM 319]|uniref:Uncharacterized protein n=2 Tax=Priestia megaterium TaxID=1404 RepID=D5DNW7_PRIM1|nr:hypothetical protein BMQ_1793 [Priestia megaterium QM B1551]ADF38585.1 hypothetical protein BMD_1731 [Priestia megaterium DSM 319]
MGIKGDFINKPFSSFHVISTQRAFLVVVVREIFSHPALTIFYCTFPNLCLFLS